MQALLLSAFYLISRIVVLSRDQGPHVVEGHTLKGRTFRRRVRSIASAIDCFDDRNVARAGGHPFNSIIVNIATVWPRM